MGTHVSCLPPYLLHSSLACSRWVKRTGQTSCEDWCSPFSRHHSLSSCCNCCNLKLWTEGSFLLWNQLYAGPALKQHKPHFARRTEARAQLHRVKQNPTFLTLKEIASSKSGAYHTQARHQCMISHVISAWSPTWSVNDQPRDQCMIRHVNIACSS